MQLSRVEYPSGQQSSSSGVNYDYSGADQILKRKDAISELQNAKLKALYEGDIAAGLSAGQRIRDLRASLSEIAPVRIESESSKSEVGFQGPKLQTHAPKEDEGDAPEKDEQAVFLPRRRRGMGMQPTDAMGGGNMSGQV